MKRFKIIWFCGLLFCLVLPGIVGSAEDDTAKKVIWSEVRPGLSLARFNAEHKPVEGLRSQVEGPCLVVLRIDPDAYRFRLLSASELDTESRTLKEWAREYGLFAAINAGMFWRDQRTSTGYMRNFGHFNQDRFHPDYNGFLVFNPKKSGLPPARIVDRTGRSDWRQVLQQYASVVQNYRLIGRKRRIAWHREGDHYSASSIAEDEKGRILFILNQEPLSMKEFSRLLLDLPLRIRACIFTEGGQRAGLYLHTPQLKRAWTGVGKNNFWSRKELSPIPNAIGIEPRKRSSSWLKLGIAPSGP